MAILWHNIARGNIMAILPPVIGMQIKVPARWISAIWKLQSWSEDVAVFLIWTEMFQICSKIYLYMKIYEVRAVKPFFWHSCFISLLKVWAHLISLLKAWAYLIPFLELWAYLISFLELWAYLISFLEAWAHLIFLLALLEVSAFRQTDVKSFQQRRPPSNIEANWTQFFVRHTLPGKSLTLVGNI